LQIHPTAIVEEGAQLAGGCIIHAHAYVTRHCQLAEGVVVHPFAVVGGDPQDLSFNAHARTGVRVGARTVIREHVTISRATKLDGYTEIGADCFLMASCHVAHDCKIGNRVIIANAVLLAGHVQVGEGSFLGGGAGIHQFCRVGEGAMISGGARISLDVPPFCMAAERNALIGLNLVGLRRRGCDRQAMSELKRIYQALNVPVGNMRELAASMLARDELTSSEARNFLRFFAGGRRQFIRARASNSDDPSPED
jgi:UDP-N-acetylglucosamine acyltransferase